MLKGQIRKVEQELICEDCDAEFIVSYEESDVITEKVLYCPFCGSDEIVDINETDYPNIEKDSEYYFDEDDE